MFIAKLYGHKDTVIAEHFKTVPAVVYTAISTVANFMEHDLEFRKVVSLIANRVQDTEETNN